MRPYELKPVSGMLHWIKRGKCICGSDIEFIESDQAGILLNAEIKGRLPIENFLMMSRACNNPMCPWSKIQEEVNAHNYTSAKKAWEQLEKIKGD